MFSSTVYHVTCKNRAIFEIRPARGNERELCSTRSAMRCNIHKCSLFFGSLRRTAASNSIKNFDIKVAVKYYAFHSSENLLTRRETALKD
ncbi:hypothetical protein PUN28_010923 [Cardiocondyla obscurior]|uniref:Uncharacterized protein n=1 Tax=Cardiocondyla obscurior TaxID=286306 RepID=A0AAW2FIR6_9HYME